MKTAISIPDELFSAADTLAEKLGISRSQLYQRAIYQFLTQQGQEAVTANLNTIFGSSSGYGAETGILDPAVEFLQGASLILDKDTEEW